MAASTADAAAGWAIYRDSDFALSLEEINARLEQLDRSPVSVRMYRHYGKLQRYGYERYVPINQLDVKTLRDPFLDQSGRGREHPIQTLTDVELRVLVDDEIRSFAGSAIELSTAEVVIRLAGDEMAEFFSNLGSATPAGEVVFRVTGEVRRGAIERLTLDVEQALSTVRVNFDSQLDLAEIVQPTIPGEEIRLTLRLDISSEPGLTEVARHMYWLAQACDAARALVSELVGQLAPGEPVDIGIVRVRSLSLGSVEIVVGVPVSVGLVLYGSFWGWLKVRQAYWSSEKMKQEALRLRWENEQDDLRGRADLLPLVRRVREALARRLGSGGVETNAEVDERRALSIAEKQLLPAVSEIVEAADGAVEIDAGDDLTDATAEVLTEIRELPAPVDEEEEEISDST